VRAPRLQRAAPTAALGAIAAAAAGAAGGALRRSLTRAEVPPAPPAPLDDWFDAAELRPGRRYRRGAWALALLGSPLAPALTVLVHRQGSRWRPPLVRAAGGRVAASGLLFGAGLAAALSAGTLPVAAARYAWGRRAGPVTQPAADWTRDAAKAAALEVVVLGAMGAGAATILRRAPRAWPIGIAALTGGGALLAAFLSPRLIEPLFQRARPLEDPELEREVLDLAARSGVPAKRVLVSDASRRTSAPNAYVSGMAGTRQIVLFDTLLRDLPRDQVRYVVAHELAHVRRRHLASRALWGAALAAPLQAAVAALVGWQTGWARPDADLALRRLSLLAAAAAVLAPLTGPAGCALSRKHEREADWDAVRVTGEPRAAIEAQRSLVSRGMGVPDPPRWVRILWGTHPTALERIGLALRAERAA
jgi:Zn-dependent protease with chaperone function